MFSRLSKWIDVCKGSWSRCSSSMVKLEAVEKTLLSHLKTPFKTQFINIGQIVGQEECKIWTLSMNEESEETPIVLLHGMGQGIVCWLFNLDELAAERPVYAIDLPGFARSSRPNFSSIPSEAENQFVDCIEAWRKEMQLEIFILLGFSLGGYWATAYAVRFPERLQHLILAKPWGLPLPPSDITFYDSRLHRTYAPLFLGIMGHIMFVLPINLFFPLRLPGMMLFGKKAILLSFEMLSKFNALGENGAENVAEYILLCKTQNPTGETAMRLLFSTSGPLWAKFPLIERIPNFLDEKISITLIYGSKSWTYKSYASEIRKLRPNSYVDEYLIEGSNHDCNVTESDSFNKIVIDACNYSDPNDNSVLSPTTLADLHMPNRNSCNSKGQFIEKAEESNFNFCN